MTNQLILHVILLKNGIISISCQKIYINWQVKRLHKK